MKRNEVVFRQKVVPAMHAVMKAFGQLTVEDAAAIFGNAGHESNGFTTFQEVKPLVPNSRGGWGWFQWTGPRRRQFEAFCKRRKLALDADEAQIQFLIYELQMSETRAIPALLAARGLVAKVEAFELAYERAGIKHYPGRVRWARVALDEWSKQYGKVQPAATVRAAAPAQSPPPVKPLMQSRTFWAQIGNYLSGVGAPLVGIVTGIDWRVVLALTAAGVIGFTTWSLWRHLQRRQRGIA